MLRKEIRRTRELTDQPFAVDLLAPIPDMMRPHMPVLLEEKVRIFVAGLAVPSEFIQTMHEHGMKVAVMCGKVHHGEKAQDAGADVVVAQGTEAGGHTGEIGTISLVPQMLRVVKLPVLAAGGIAHGSQIAAALMLGAQGVVIGTRFIATPEAQAAQVYRDSIVKARDDTTTAHACLHRQAVPRHSHSVRARMGAGPVEDSAVPDAGADFAAQRRDGIHGLPGRSSGRGAHVHADRAGRGLDSRHQAGRRGVRRSNPRDRGRTARRAGIAGRPDRAAAFRGPAPVGGTLTRRGDLCKT